MILRERFRRDTLTKSDIEDIKKMSGKYGNFFAMKYHQPKNEDENWIEISFWQSPVNGIDIWVLISIIDDIVKANVKIQSGNKVLFERESKGKSVSSYGVLPVVFRMFLTDLSDLIKYTYSDSYFMCHLSTGDGERLSDYYKLFDEDYLDKQVKRLKDSISYLKKYIDKF